MSRPVQPAIDAYGTYARASNLADYVELLALQGEKLTLGQLADLIRDQGWTTKMNELFTTSPQPQEPEEEEEDEPESVGEDEGVPQARRVFNILEQRGDVLGDRYPFELTTWLSLGGTVDVRESPYIALLAVTVAHAHGIEVKPEASRPALDPKQVIEAVVIRALETLTLTCSNVGEVSRACSDFRETVTVAGKAVGLSPTPEAAVSLINANEEGVDALAHLGSTDSRAGHWIFIGQVTCGKSETWKRKLGEPSSPDWKKYLNILVDPQGFLALPHHVEDHQLTKLVHGGNRMVLDRLRLTRLSSGVSPEERAIIDAVVAAGVERRA